MFGVLTFGSFEAGLILVLDGSHPSRALNLILFKATSSTSLLLNVKCAPKLIKPVVSLFGSPRRIILVMFNLRNR